MLHHLIEELFIALMLSSTYILIAIGFTILFGAINIIQFAHGDVTMLGALFGIIVYYLADITGVTLILPKFLCVAVSIVVTLLIIGGCGVLFERAVIKPFRVPGLPALMVLVSTVSLGIFIRESVRLFYPEGGNPQLYPILFPQGGFELGGFYIRFLHIIVIGTTLILILGLIFFINRTKIGLAIRALSENTEAVGLMGINQEIVIIVTFFVVSMVAGIAGILIGSYYKVIKFDMGLLGGLKGFTAAIVGGLGSFNGAILGGLTLGFVETICCAYIPGGAPYKDVYGFLMVIFFLVFRPEGLLGEITYKKV